MIANQQTCPDCAGHGQVVIATYTSRSVDWDACTTRVVVCDLCLGAGEIERDEEEAAQ